MSDTAPTTASPDAATQPAIRRRWVLVLILVAAVAVGGARYTGAFGGSHAPASASVSAAVGGVCSDSGYSIENQVTGKRQTIWNCDVPSRGTTCVTYDGGVAVDATAETRLVFAGVIGGNRPACLGS